MKDLQEIWDNIPQINLAETEVEAITKMKSSNEIARFKKLLKIEIYTSVVLFFALLFSNLSPEIDLMIPVGLTVLFGSVANLVILQKVKKLAWFDDTKAYLKRAIDIIRSFIITFLISAQVMMVMILAFFSVRIVDILTYQFWFGSDAAWPLISVILFSEIILSSYAWFFYVPRIRRMKTLLAELEA